MFRLPVSGMRVALRQPSGSEDVLLLESPACDIRAALALVARVARPLEGETEWGALPLTDIDALLLSLRRAVFGDTVRADVRCPVEGCGEKVDVAFRVGEYLEHHRPRAARGAEPDDEPGWFRLKGTAVKFRLPTGVDLSAVADSERPDRELMSRCVRPASLSARLRARVERAVEALAPSLSDDLQGKCPECGAAIDIRFDPRQFTLRELREQARYVFEDVHLIALHYHWPEAEILALPRDRRINYAELIRRERSLD